MELLFTLGAGFWGCLFILIGVGLNGRNNYHEGETETEVEE